MKISIIVRTCNLDRLKKCISSIMANTDLTKADAEIIVSMNGCDPEGISYCQSLGLRFVWIDTRIGAILATNLAAQISKGEFLVPMDDDVEILCWGANNDWLHMLMAPFIVDEKMGQTGPMIERSYGEYLGLTGCVTMTRKSQWDQLGGLDMFFHPGVGDDIDYSIRLQKAGYKITGVPNNNVLYGSEHTYPFFHASISDYSIPRAELIATNEAKLIERHGPKADSPFYLDRGDFHFFPNIRN